MSIIALTAGGRSTRLDLATCSPAGARLPLVRLARSSSSPPPRRSGRAGSMSNIGMPAFEAQVLTRLPVERGSCLVACDKLGAGSGTGDSADRATGPEWVDNEDRTANTTFGGL